MIHFFAKARTLFLLIPSVLFGTNSINAQAVGTDFTQSTTLTALANPWDINFGPDGFLWWTESKNYKLFRSDVYAGTPTKIEVFDFSSSRLFAANNNPFPQGGLMGFAFHPDFATRPFIYVAYVYRFDGCITTNVSCNFRNRIERYTYNASGTPKLTNPVTLIDLPGSSDHNGGRMSVGPDNKLYYCQSDMGAGQFANTFRTHNAQNINVLEGKVLRLNMDPDAGESGGNEWIPNDNPFTDGGNKTAVYTLGHRNHQGIVWANLGGGVNKLYQSEHGPQSDDEFNVIESGRNYGYPYVTGPADGNYNNIDNGPYTCGPTNGNPTEQTHATTYNVKMPLSTLGTTVASPNTNPESSNATWPSVAPAGIDYYGLYPNGPVAGWSNSAIVATLKISSRNPSIQRVSLSTDGNTATNLYNYWTNNVRYRDVAIAPNGRDIFIIQDAASANLYRQRYQNTVASNAGFFATGGGLITYTLNGGSPVNAYNNNANLGFPTSFILNGGIIHTTKTGSGNICSGTLNYRVYKQGTTPGAFTALTGFANDANTTFTTTATPANVTGNTTGQQRWSKSDAAVDVLALATTPGFWVVETYFEATGSVSSSSLCTDGFRLSNGGYNYRYYFGKGPVPNTNTLSPLSAITYGSATPVTLTATISDENPGTGTVTFKIDGNTVGTGTVNAAGVATFSYTPNNLSASGSPHVVTAELVSANYASTIATTNWTVNKAVLTVTAAAKSKTYDGSVFSPFTSTITGYVNSETSSVVTGSVTYGGGAATAVNAGSYTITPVLSGLSASNYTFSAINGTLTIGKVNLTLTADNKNKTYNNAVFSPFTSTYTGFVNSETASVVTAGTKTFSGAATTAVNAGTYNTIIPAVSGFTATNYTCTTFVNGTLQIDKALLTVTADAKSKTYNGAVFSPFTSTYSGFVSGQTSSVVTGTITYSGTAVSAVNSGTYTITPVVTGLSATNYSFAAANGSLQINKVSLTVTADAKSKAYDGSVFSPFTSTYSGFVNSETSSVVSGTVAYSGAAITAVNFGTYTITPVVTGLNATNYSFIPANGTLQINKVLLTATADNKSKTYNGAVFSPFTTTYTGFVNSENASVVTGTVTYTGSAVSAINFGTYTITPIVTGISATNYNFTSANGTLQIDKAALTITADNITVNYQDAVPALTYTVTGYVNSENASVLTGFPNLSTSYTNATPVASSPVSIIITAGSLSATNYSFTFQNGQITILPLSYYNISGTDPSNINNWGANTDGSGVHPMNFSTSKYTFFLSNGSNSLNANLTISGILNMAGGMLYIGNNNLTCSSIFGGSLTSFIGTNGTGKVKILNIGAGGQTGNVQFPVGIGPYYAPMIIINSSGTSDAFSVNVKISFAGTGFVSHPDSVVNLVWDITEDVPGGSNAALTLGWNTVNEAANFNAAGLHVIGHFTGGKWVATPGTTVVGTPNTVSASGFTSFSPFAVGMAGAFETASLQLKVLLQGAVTGNGPGAYSIMRDNLRNSPFTNLNYIPNSDPYTTNPSYTSLFTAVGDGLDGSYQTILNPATMFANRNGTSKSAVDWIFIELRSKADPKIVIATRSAIVQQDGTVVDIDGGNCVRFPTLPVDDYYVAIRHRNHLGAMTATPVSSSAFGCGSVVDFTTMSNTDLWHNPLTPQYNGLEMATLDDGKRALWAGNANGDKKIKYTAPDDDVFQVFLDALLHPGNTGSDYNFDFGFGYWAGDVDMNSKVKYTSPDDDLFVQVVQLLLYSLNIGGDYNYDFFIEQLPY